MRNRSVLILYSSALYRGEGSHCSLLPGYPSGVLPRAAARLCSTRLQTWLPERANTERGGENVNRVHLKAYFNMVASLAINITFTLATLCVCVFMYVNKKFVHLIYYKILDRVKLYLGIFGVKGIGFCVLFSTPTCPVIGVSSLGKGCV